MEKQQFTIDKDNNKIFDRYVENWQEWPKSESVTSEQRIGDLEDFAFCHEELLYDLYAKIDTLKEEIRQLKNGRE